jgi:pimeloyl-ACP methyl ester carboxylesterase
MMDVLYSNNQDLDIILEYDPFVDKRKTLRISRRNSGYNISLIDVNENPSYDYTIVCVHGWGSNALNFRFLLKLLSPHFRVIAYDLKGHGESDKDDDSYDLELYTNELSQVINYIANPNIVLLGHSMGTSIVLNYLCQNPKNVKAAVVLSGAADFREPIPKIIPILLTYMDERIKNLIAEIIASFITSKKTDERILDLEKEHFKRTPYYVCRRALLNTIFEWKKSEDLHNIKIPVLIMTGEKDSLTSVKDSIKLRSLLPNSRLVILPDAKHDLPMAQGIESATLVKEFVEYHIDLERVKIKPPIID